MKYQEFLIGDLFDIESSKRKINACDVEISSKGFPYVVRTSQNNGIRGYIDENPAFLNEGNTISFGQDTATIFYQPTPYFTGDKIKILKLRNHVLNEKIAQFLLCVMRKAFSNFSWGSSSFDEEVIKKMAILLPVNDSGKINYTFMEEYMDQLSKESVLDSARFLADKNTGSYELSEAERALMTRRVQYKDFRIGDLFEKLPAPYKGKNRKQDNVSKTLTSEFNLPLINCKWGNNGIMYYGRESDFTYYENVLSIIYNGPPTVGTVYAQERIGVYTDSYLVALKKEIMPVMTMMLCLYLKTAIEKSIHDTKYSRADKATWENKVENDSITLPITKDGTPDFEYMEQYMRIQEKMVLREIFQMNTELLNTGSCSNDHSE